MLTEYGPLFAACGAVIVAAFLAYLASRKPKTLTDTEVDKLKTEIKKGQLDNEAAKALADIKRDRHIHPPGEVGFREGHAVEPAGVCGHRGTKPCTRRTDRAGEHPLHASRPRATRSDAANRRRRRLTYLDHLPDSDTGPLTPSVRGPVRRLPVPLVDLPRLINQRRSRMQQPQRDVRRLRPPPRQHHHPTSPIPIIINPLRTDDQGRVGDGFMLIPQLRHQLLDGYV
jgi:hypothetical protein